jgi:hypothetical protein
MIAIEQEKTLKMQLLKIDRKRVEDFDPDVVCYYVE